MTKTIVLAAIAAVLAVPAAAVNPKQPAKRAAPPAGKVETMRVAAISLTEEDGTVITLKDAAGVKLEPVKIPLTVCRKDHLGRLLPGMDVDVAVETRVVAGKKERFVRAERFRSWCS